MTQKRPRAGADEKAPMDWWGEYRYSVPVKKAGPGPHIPRCRTGQAVMAGAV
ncbi:hypothetical protein ACIGHN_03935 [Acidovorax sp. NPDC077693]|uniref:hypothetical protein n=1 Tax=unclassified Acidovorax TaxID=2684926 RepID=UPI0037C569D3